MSKKEIKVKLDEIIDFAGCQLYIDTPLKRFSSGMRVRLGFAVAAFLEPEILIVDEVLAVGDAEFQKKAIGKMKDISSGGGRTVLFVSHNMASIKSLCTRAIVLERGGIKYNGIVDEALKNYLSEGKIDGINEFKEFKGGENYANEKVTIKSIGIKAKSKKYGDAICLDEEIELSLSYENKDHNNRLDATIQFKDSFGNYLFALSTTNVKTIATSKYGAISCKVIIPRNFFTANTFHLNLLIVQNGKSVALKVEDILVIDILPKKNEVGQFMGKGQVPLTPQFKWEIAE